MRRLEIDFDEVAAALESSREMNEFFLDLATGEVVVIPTELLEQDWLEEDPADLPAWEQALLPVVRAIQEGSERYARVPEVPSYEIYLNIYIWQMVVARIGIMLYTFSCRKIFV